MTSLWFTENLPPADREQELIERYLLIADPQERLQALCSRHHGTPALPDADRIPDYLVRECSSPLWLRQQEDSGELLALEIISTSPLIRSLAGIHADLAHLAPRSAVQAFTPQWLENLRLTPFLSSSRQHGLTAVWLRIQALASTPA
jgi:sulfur transfer protein SufE